jgi:hypothetical protein
MCSGFGFVTYKTVEAAKKAIDDPNKILAVSYYKLYVMSNIALFMHDPWVICLKNNYVFKAHKVIKEDKNRLAYRKLRNCINGNRKGFMAFVEW